MRGNKGFEMNQRIRELADEAVTRVALRCEGSMESDKHGEWIRYDDLEKFAELMVQDCIRILHSNGYDDAAKCLQEIHFGIENPV